MTPRLLLAVLAAASAHAAVIRGNVVENFTGKLLTRALVILQPLPGTPAEVRSMRTTSLGRFEFDNLPAGAYLVKASRRGFLPTEYGQKRWNSAGVPIMLEDADTTFLAIRLPRYSAIGGTIVDENEIGLPGHEVAVYRWSDPPELIRQSTADDRGVYRIGGLEPGKYVVRTVGRQYEDGGYLPTFSREASRAEEAQLIDVFLEQQTDRIDVRPLPGKLFSVLVGWEPADEATVTLASALGRTTVKGVPPVRFNGQSPGDYEVYLEMASGEGAYQRFVLNRDMPVTLLAQPGSNVTFAGAPANGAGVLWVRRKDLAGTGQISAREAGTSVPLPPGRWEVLLAPPTGYYVSAAPSARGRPDGWLEFLSRTNSNLRLILSSGPGAIRGSVKDAPYAPVYLEGYDPASRKRVGELQTTRADSRGQYRFGGLAPGSYRLLSTVEYNSPDTATMDLAAAPTVLVSTHGDVTKDLDLWVIR